MPEYNKISVNFFARFFRLLKPLEVSGLSLTIISSIYFLFVVNWRLSQIYFMSNEINSMPGLFQYLSFVIFVGFLLLSIFVMFNIKYLQKAFLILVILVSVPAAFFSIKFGAMYDKVMLTNLFQTNKREILELLSPKLCLVILTFGVLPASFILRMRIRYKVAYKQVLLNVILAITFLFIALSATYPFYKEISGFVRANNTALRHSFLPSAIIYSVYKTMTPKSSPIDKQQDKSARIVLPADKPTLLVTLIGETARAKTFFHETPNMKSFLPLDFSSKNLFVYPDVTACGTSTAVSLPCIFSLLDKKTLTDNYIDTHENLVELIARLGIKTTWIENDGGCKGVCSRVDTIKVDNTNSKARKHENEYYDQALVDLLDSKISEEYVNQAIFLHQLGSHGPAYYKRVPERYKLYRPECTSIDFSGCTDEEIKNSYYNTVSYTKEIISIILQKLKTLEAKYNVVFLYFSDHGESLGESGYYLHGIPFSLAPVEQTQVPLLMWLSDGYLKSENISNSCIKSNLHKALSHDWISNTILSILRIESSYRDENKSLIGKCSRIS